MVQWQICLIKCYNKSQPINQTKSQRSKNLVKCLPISTERGEFAEAAHSLFSPHFDCKWSTAEIKLGQILRYHMSV